MMLWEFGCCGKCPAAWCDLARYCFCKRPWADDSVGSQQCLPSHRILFRKQGVGLIRVSATRLPSLAEYKAVGVARMAPARKPGKLTVVPQQQQHSAQPRMHRADAEMCPDADRSTDPVARRT